MTSNDLLCVFYNPLIYCMLVIYKCHNYKLVGENQLELLSYKLKSSQIQDLDRTACPLLNCPKF